MEIDIKRYFIPQEDHSSSLNKEQNDLQDFLIVFPLAQIIEAKNMTVHENELNNKSYK